MTDFVSDAAGGFVPEIRPDTRRPVGDLPPGLADAFVLVKTIQVPVRPTQPLVLRVRRADEDASAAPLVLKWYHWQFAPDEKVVRLLAENPGRHLERLVQQGESDGHPYLVFRSHGETDLAAYLEENRGRPMPPGRISEIARQLYEAVTTLHDNDVVHRDITPDNIMVESRRGDRLELVLIDFGVAAHGGDGHTGARRPWRGKPGYLAPEAGPVRQTVSPEGDWWSVGMVLAELALGGHPVPFYSDEAVLREIATNDPDLSAIEDRRTRLLCEGLLTRSLDSRWNAEKVDDWLHGGSPRVAPRSHGRQPEAAPDDGIRPFDLLGERITEPEHLAQRLDLHHAAAARMLGNTRERDALRDWLGQFETAGGRGPEELARLAALREELRTPPGPATAARLIAWLGPYREASWWGIPLSVEGVRALGTAALRGDEEAVALVRQLVAAPEILTVLGRLPRGQDLDGTAERWAALRTRWPGLARNLRHNPDLAGRDRVRRALRHTTAVDAHLLQLAREPDRAAARLEAEAARVRGRLLEPVLWFDRLTTAGQEDPLLLLAAVLLSEHAVRAAVELHRDRVEEETQRLMDEDTDGVITFMRHQDHIPTLGWALLGGILLTVPWIFVVELADIFDRATQRAVLLAWLVALPAAAAVFALELLTAAYIGPPAYHPHRSLAGLVIRSAERPGRWTLSRGLRTLVPAAAVVLAAVFLGFYAIAVAPWLWPVASVLGIAAWSVRRCLVWRRGRRRRAEHRTGVRRGTVEARRL